jgi:hypothetical protein
MILPETFNNFHLIKVRNTYVGCNHSNKKPVVFAFVSEQHVRKVQESMFDFKYETQQFEEKSYIMKPISAIEFNRNYLNIDIEEMGFFDTQLHLSMNNVDMFIVDSVYKDEMNNISLINLHSEVEPLFINDNMKRLHLNKLVAISKSNQ